MTAKTFKKPRLICHIVAVSDKLHPHTVDEHFSFVAEICTGVLQVNGTTWTAYEHIPQHNNTTVQIIWFTPAGTDPGMMTETSAGCWWSIWWNSRIFTKELWHATWKKEFCKQLSTAEASRGEALGNSVCISMGWWPALLYKLQTIFLQEDRKSYLETDIFPKRKIIFVI